MSERCLSPPVRPGGGYPVGFGVVVCHTEK